MQSVGVGGLTGFKDGLRLVERLTQLVKPWK